MVGNPDVTVTREALPSTPPLPDPSPSYGRRLLEEHYRLIQERLDRLSRRSGFPKQEAEELRSWALFKLVENDYRILSRWEGRSSFSTFLSVVLVNLLHDYRCRVWGKWRPSAAARRLGPTAIHLERLWARDRLPLDQAVERLRAEHGIVLSQDEAERLTTVLRRAPEREFVGEEELLQIPVDGEVESRLEERKRARTERRLQEVLSPLLQSIPAQDRRLLKLHFWDGLSMAAISPLLGRPQRELYTLRDKCLKKLRHYLQQAGLDSVQARDLLGHSQLTLLPEGMEPGEAAVSPCSLKPQHL